MFCADWASDGTGGNEAIYGQLQEGRVILWSVGENTETHAVGGQLSIETLHHLVKLLYVTLFPYQKCIQHNKKKKLICENFGNVFKKKHYLSIHTLFCDT